MFSYSFNCKSSMRGPVFVRCPASSYSSPSSSWRDFCNLCRLALALSLACSCFSFSGSARVDWRLDTMFLVRNHAVPVCRRELARLCLSASLRDALGVCAPCPGIL